MAGKWLVHTWLVHTPANWIILKRDTSLILYMYDLSLKWY